jgi:hypothetical protein
MLFKVVFILFWLLFCLFNTQVSSHYFFALFDLFERKTFKHFFIASDVTQRAFFSSGQILITFEERREESTVYNVIKNQILVKTTLFNLVPTQSNGPRKVTLRNEKVLTMHIYTVFNSEKHGITSRSLLHCKKVNCLYYDVCTVRDFLIDYPADALCVVEIIRAEDLRKGYVVSLSSVPESLEKAAFIQDLILNDLRKIRLENVVAITSTVPGCTGNDQLIAPHVLLRYYNELAAERMKLYCRAKMLLSEAKEEIPPSC